MPRRLELDDEAEEADIKRPMLARPEDSARGAAQERSGEATDAAVVESGDRSAPRRANPVRFYLAPCIQLIKFSKEYWFKIVGIGSGHYIC